MPQATRPYSKCRHRPPRSSATRPGGRILRGCMARNEVRGLQWNRFTAGEKDQTLGKRNSALPCSSFGGKRCPNARLRWRNESNLSYRVRHALAVPSVAHSEARDEWIALGTRIHAVRPLHTGRYSDWSGRCGHVKTGITRSNGHLLQWRKSAMPMRRRWCNVGDP
jgi:hypothetical protein